MSEASNPEITRVIDAVSAGDTKAAERLLPLVYDELRRLAQARLSKLPPGQTLQATALVHEAYLRIAKKEPVEWDGRYHFFFAASRAMRDIIVENARRKASLKRGGGFRRVALDGSGISLEPPSGDVLAVNEAVEKLEQTDPERARIVLLRYFAGLTGEETADVLGVSVSYVDRAWRLIRAWLRRELSTGEGSLEVGSDG